jgi:hypothetical protein
MKNTKKDYIIKLKGWVNYSTETYYLTAFNETGFVGGDTERDHAKRFAYDEAIQTCYEVLRFHSEIKLSQLEIIKR